MSTKGLVQNEEGVWFDPKTGRALPPPIDREQLARDFQALVALPSPTEQDKTVASLVANVLAQR